MNLNKKKKKEAEIKKTKTRKWLKVGVLNVMSSVQHSSEERQHGRHLES